MLDKKETISTLGQAMYFLGGILISYTEANSPLGIAKAKLGNDNFYQVFSNSLNNKILHFIDTLCLDNYTEVQDLIDTNQEIINNIVGTSLQDAIDSSKNINTIVTKPVII
jgi:hypothetical protein